MDDMPRAEPSFHAPFSRFDFDRVLAESGCSRLVRSKTTTLQLNVGNVCQQACRHCHVDAGPKRAEAMGLDVARQVLKVLERSSSITIVDITGGAPELNPNFQLIVSEARRLGCHVIDRCNLTVLLEPGSKNTAEFLAQHEAEIVASLPCYTPQNVDKQRGEGVFDKSILAIRMLNDLGYGMPGSTLRLNLAYNPLGASLPPLQRQLEADYRLQLREKYGVEFHRLFAITNLPIGRFASALNRRGEFEAYLQTLADHFNRQNIENLMCRSLLSVGWDGALCDCDFNQMLGLRVPVGPQSIWNITCFDELDGTPIKTGSHCFGCAAGSGSGCGGSLQ